MRRARRVLALDVHRKRLRTSHAGDPRAAVATRSADTDGWVIPRACRRVVCSRDVGTEEVRDGVRGKL